MRVQSAVLGALVAAVSLLVPGCSVDERGSTLVRGAPTAVTPAAGHPRLFVRETDLPRLRSWAAPDNPVYAQGLARLAATAKTTMDEGTVPAKDTGLVEYDAHPTELYAELFAFMSLIEPDEAARADYGRRARDLLMYVIDKALPGVGAEGQPFRDPRFATYNRSRWQGEAFGLTVDWAYPYFSAEDRAKIRTVFLRWSQEQFTAYPATAAGGGASDFTRAGPTPDPALLADPRKLRWSTNNYFTAHPRNMALMALSLDEADDPGGELRGYLRDALGLWHYQTDRALRTDAAGGLSPEGTEYTQSSVAYMIQLLAALHTAGADDTARFGPQVAMADNPFFAQFLPAMLHSISPLPAPAPPDVNVGSPVYLPAAYGDISNYFAPELTTALVPLALYAADRGDRATVDAVRWYITNASPGGAADLTDRVGNTDQFFASILYFLALDPKAPPAADPRPAMPLSHTAPGLHRYFARTCWCPEARWFNYSLTWKTIDHQGSDGNDFGFYRKGEWLTKLRNGYDTPWYTDYNNTLTIENVPPGPEFDERYVDIARRGAQEPLVSEADPTVLAQGQGEGWFYALGDATPLYNWTRDNRNDVLHASRSIVWLQPDHIVIYDRAETRTPGRFKRFWLQMPAPAEVAGQVATVRTPGGQQVITTTLEPAGAKITSTPYEPAIGNPAIGEPMRDRLEVEAPGGPAGARFLHVVQGADGGAAADPAVALTSTAGRPYTGAAVAGTAVLFPVDIGAAVDTTTVTVPAGVRRTLVTGLVPGGAYQVTSEPSGNGAQIIVTQGGPTAADAAGVLVVGG